MRFVLSLVLCFGFLAQILCEEAITSGHSHFCLAHYKARVLDESFPVCPANTDCISCLERRRRNWLHSPDCPDCCYQPVRSRSIVPRTIRVCCPGYFGRNCDRAFCDSLCREPGTDCIAPNTCGQVCDPLCRNGGTCVIGEKNNVCVCEQGWTGSSCEVEMCDPPCENGGRCTGESCSCINGFTGDYCQYEPEMCDPPCENGGRCTGESCSCINGFTGDYCQYEPEYDST